MIPDIEAARKKARTAYMAVSGISGFIGVGELIASDNAAAFAGFTLASILAVIVRHLLLHDGPADLLRMFTDKPRADR